MRSQTTERFVDLKEETFVVTRRLSGRLESLAPKTRFNLLEYEAGQMVMELEARLLGDEPRSVEIRYPADWREALKGRFAPAWFLTRWPVREMVHTIEAQALLPNVCYPRDTTVVRMLTHTQQAEEARA